MPKNSSVNLVENIIYLIRGEKVILDVDLAKLYGVDTGALKRAVKRNPDRFPPDFMFQLSKEEFESLRCQFGISKGKGGTRYLPFVFTEQGVSMLSSVLRSSKAIQVNIAIMRTFVKMRRILVSNEEVAKGLRELEKKTGQLFQIVFDRFEQLEMSSPALPKERNKIGLKPTNQK